MTDAKHIAERAGDQSAGTAVVVYLSGRRRGRTQKLVESAFRLDPIEAGDAVLVPADRARGSGHLGSLHRAGGRYELVMEPGRNAWVNGEATHTRLLQPGDLVEIESGPVFRFRVYPPGASVHKSVADVFGDCVDCARRDRRSFVRKAPGLMADMLRDLATQTSLWFRGAVLVALAVLAGVIALQGRQVQNLEQSLARVEGLAELLRRGDSEKLTREDLAAVRSEIHKGLVETGERVAALEARTAAVGRIIAEFSASVVFIQGAYGFRHEATGRPLRVALGPDGRPLRMPDGEAVVTLEGKGPPVEVNFTGTAFVVDANGFMLTNRHVAMPWETGDSAKHAQALGLAPVMRRMLGYLSGAGEPFELTLRHVSDQFDLAVLTCDDTARLRAPLKLASASPIPGDEVIVLGYPTGIRALLARAGDRFVERLTRRKDLDFWGVTRELAQAGLVNPLASRGIVGQTTREAIVYDAETTSGGSGGPVLDLNGEVVAVNTAIIPEFGGSNMGVPIEHARSLLAQAAARK